MEKLLQEIKDIKSFSFATIGINEKPSNRMMDIMDVDFEDQGLYFLTGAKKELVKELQKNKYVCLNALTFDNITYRIDGEVEFRGDVKELLEKNPGVDALYGGSSGDMTAFYVQINEAIKYDIKKGAEGLEVYR